MLPRGRIRGATAGDGFDNLRFQGVKLGVAAADDLQVAPLKGGELAAERRQFQLRVGKLGLQPRELLPFAPQFLLLRRMEARGFRIDRGTV